MICKKKSKFVDSDVYYRLDDSVTHVFWEEYRPAILLDQTTVIQTYQQQKEIDYFWLFLRNLRDKIVNEVYLSVICLDRMKHDIGNDHWIIKKEIPKRDKNVRKILVILERQHISDYNFDLIWWFIQSKIFLEYLAVRKMVGLFVGKIDDFLFVNSLYVLFDKLAGEIAEGKNIFFIFLFENVDESLKSDWDLVLLLVHKIFWLSQEESLDVCLHRSKMCFFFDQLAQQNSEASFASQ